MICFSVLSCFSVQVLNGSSDLFKIGNSKAEVVLANRRISGMSSKYIQVDHVSMISSFIVMLPQKSYNSPLEIT